MAAQMQVQCARPKSTSSLASGWCAAASRPPRLTRGTLAADRSRTPPTGRNGPEGPRRGSCVHLWLSPSWSQLAGHTVPINAGALPGTSTLRMAVST